MCLYVPYVLYINTCTLAVLVGLGDDWLSLPPPRLTLLGFTGRCLSRRQAAALSGEANFILEESVTVLWAGGWPGKLLHHQG